MKRIVITFVILSRAAAACAPAKIAPLPDDPVAQYPKMKAGDKYTFVISGLDEEQWEVVEVRNAGSFTLRESNVSKKTHREMRVDTTYHITSDTKTVLGNIKLDFPLFPGKEWTDAYEVRPNVQATVNYRVTVFETVQTGAGSMKVFKIKYSTYWPYTGAASMGGTNFGELWYSPEAKMIVHNDYVSRSHKLLAYSVADDSGKRMAGGSGPAQVQTARTASSAASSPAKPAAAAVPSEAVRQAEEKIASALKEQQEKEAALKARAQQLAEKEAALKAEANRLTEEKLASEAKRLEEREAALKVESERLESEKRAAVAKGKKDKEDAAKSLIAAKVRAEAENIEANIPVSLQANGDAIAVVIGNRDYKNARMVSFAINDAELMKKYLVSTLGYKEGNVFFIANASKAEFELYFGNDKSHRGKLFNAVKQGRSDVFIYYSGHGAPGIKDRKGYFVPVEADPQYLELSGYPLEVLYENLAKLPARSTTVVLDACFSGSTVYENISPLVLEVQDPVIKAKNMVVLASAGGTQVSSWYHEKSHSMFTYFLLKALKDKTSDTNRDGKLTYDEVYSYIADKSEGVPYYARRINGVEQNPTISGQYQGKIFMAY